MANEILSYIQMGQRQGVSFQRGMNFEVGENHSVILMSVRPGAPHADRLGSLQPHHSFVQGGSSSTPDNIQLLCGKHNLEKHDRIE